MPKSVLILFSCRLYLHSKTCTTYVHKASIAPCKVLVMNPLVCTMLEYVITKLKFNELYGERSTQFTGNNLFSHSTCRFRSLGGTPYPLPTVGFPFSSGGNPLCYKEWHVADESVKSLCLHTVDTPTSVRRRQISGLPIQHC